MLEYQEAVVTSKVELEWNMPESHKAQPLDYLSL